MLNPFDFAPHSLRSGTSPHKLRGTSQAKLREAPLKAPVKNLWIHLSFRRVEPAL